MKAILVVDLPDDVNMDRVIQTPVALSFSLGDGIKQIMFADGYLKPMPKKPNPVDMELEPYIKPSDAEKWEFYCIGFNDALKEITGETE